MGLHEMVAKLLMGIGHSIGKMDTKEQKVKMLERIGPKQMEGGFLMVQCVICCPCGNPVTLHASPTEATEDEFADMKSKAEYDPATKVILMKAPGVPDDAPSKIATNMGHTHIRCSECNQQFLACWEFDACKINNDIKVPWEDPEFPDSPSSELDFSGVAPQGKTVH
jgi:hypothetical protein